MKVLESWSPEAAMVSTPGGTIIVPVESSDRVERGYRGRRVEGEAEPLHFDSDGRVTARNVDREKGWLGPGPPGDALGEGSGGSRIHG